MDEHGKAVTAHAAIRWAVSGKTEYDNKGQPVRTWLPFYLNDWRPVSDQRTGEGLYADTHLYDATGRVCRVITAAGYERRTQYYPGSRSRRTKTIRHDRTRRAGPGRVCAVAWQARWHPKSPCVSLTLEYNNQLFGPLAQPLCWNLNADR